MSKASEEWAKRPYGRVITEEEIKKRSHPAWPYIYFNPGTPVAPEKVDEILKGVIDIHIHGAPLGGWHQSPPPLRRPRRRPPTHPPG